MRRKRRRYGWKSLANSKGRPYRSRKYLNFRRLVLERDKWTCQWPRCKKHINEGTRLVVHHIKRWVDRKDLRYTVSNGIALCWNCHGKTIRKEKHYEDMLKKIVKRNTDAAA